MKRMRIFPHIEPLTHGGKNKANRITWAIQGRAERGRLVFKKGKDWKHFIDQFLDFPNPMAHDDLLDALSYIDQIATTNYNIGMVSEEFVPLDVWTGI
jgi:phage terminase large subunit-like protein